MKTLSEGLRRFSPGDDYISLREGEFLMDSSEIQKALDSSVELQITVTGRKSGGESTPVWFVREGKTVFLLPVRGSKNQWYKNVLKSRRIKISSGKVLLDLAAKPVSDSKKVSLVADKFRKKHGASDVKKYYTRFDAGIELSLPWYVLGSEGSFSARSKISEQLTLRPHVP